MDAETFTAQLIGEFPEIRDSILDEDNLGLASLQIMSFMAFTQKAINANDLELVKRCFTFIDRIFDIVNSSINNSLSISYIGKLNFKENNEAMSLLSTKLSKVRAELNQAYVIGSKNDKLNSFIKNLKADQS